jgi:hypothetical protein
MSGPYGIRVTIAGQVINTTVAGANPAYPTVVDELTVVWGRASIYAQPDPSQATLTLLDRTGRYVDGSALTGERLEVYLTGEAAGDRRVFRGTITDPTCERISLDGASVYEVTVVASDPAADLGRYIGPGDYYSPQQTDFGAVTLGGGAYTMGLGNDRVNTLMNRGPAGPPPTDVPSIVTDIESPPRQATGHDGDSTYSLYLGAVEASGNVSVLDIIREASRLQPLGWVNYDPAIDVVRMGRLATAAALRLALVGGRIVIQPAPPADGSGAALMLDAGVIEVPEGYKLEASTDNAVDRIVVPRLKTVYSPDGPPISGVQYYRQIATRTMAWQNMARLDPKRYGVRQVDYGLTFGGDENSYASSPYNYGTNGMVWLLQQIGAYVDGYNGSYRLPRLRYRVSRDAAVTDDTTEMLINPRTHARPLFFSGSVFNGLAGVPSQVQAIGGVVGYSAGSWWADLLTVPAAGASTTGNLTVSQLVTNAGPTLADFDPSISLADLGLIKTGLN